MPKLIIDNKEHDVPNGITLIQACGLAGIEIPRFCYHERLSIAGNCRMCLVEVAGMPKPVASCAMSVNDLRPGRDGTPPTIITNSPTVKKAREGVLEFLLINHPLDCPICDQGGECDLQDQTMAYGFDAGRFADNKRAVEDKYLGPLIETYMTRCIHCTRCIRFMTEVAGVEELGAIGRGEDMEITTYLEHGMMSELSGNVVDLCPVGALTSKPYAFMARPWELTKTQSIDVMDALGSNIRVDSRGREVMRVLPRVNDAINEEWISDKTRHVWDGLRVQRLDRPYLRRNGRLEAVTWDEAFRAIAERLRGLDGKRFAAIAGDLAAAEEMFALKLLAEQLGSPNIDCRQDGAKLDPALGRATYLFNATIEGIDHADAILLIGTNPRLEAPVLNSRILKRWRQTQGHVPIGLIGTQADLTYPYEHLGAGPETLAKLAGGNRIPSSKRSKAPNGPWSSSVRRLWRDLTAPQSCRSPPRQRWPWARSSPTSAGTGSACCTPPPPASPASTSASCPAKAAGTLTRSSTARRRARSMWSTCSAPTRSIRTGLARPSSSIRGAMATAAPTAPM